MATGKLGSALLTLNTDTLLFTAATDQTFNVRFCNQNATSVAVRLAVGPNAGVAPAAADYLSYDVTVQANGILEDIAIVAAAGEKVWVRSSASNVSVNAYGL